MSQLHKRWTRSYLRQDKTRWNMVKVGCLSLLLVPSVFHNNAPTAIHEHKNASESKKKKQSKIKGAWEEKVLIVITSHAHRRKRRPSAVSTSPPHRIRPRPCTCRPHLAPRPPSPTPSLPPAYSPITTRSQPHHHQQPHSNGNRSF